MKLSSIYSVRPNVMPQQIAPLLEDKPMSFPDSHSLCRFERYYIERMFSAYSYEFMTGLSDLAIQIRRDLKTRVIVWLITNSSEFNSGNTYYPMVWLASMEQLGSSIARMKNGEDVDIEKEEGFIALQQTRQNVPKHIKRSLSTIFCHASDPQVHRNH